MKELTRTSRLAGALEKLYRMLNADFFEGKLLMPIITIQASPRSYGHYTLYDAWDVKGEPRREINISSGTLDRPIENIAATMLHEMVHQFNAEVLHVQDCSGSSRAYHNNVFRECAEAHGLVVERSEKYGWSHTEPGDTLLDWILTHDIPEIRMNRPDEPEPISAIGGSSTKSRKPRPKSGGSRKHVCPVCGLIARTTRPAKLVCGECMIPMVQED